MTTIGMHYDVLPGKERLFTDAIAKVIDLCKTLGGHVDTRCFEDVQSKGSFVILSQWESKEQFEAFIHSDAFRQTVNWGKENILRGRPQHKVYLNA